MVQSMHTPWLLPNKYQATRCMEKWSCKLQPTDCYFYIYSWDGIPPNSYYNHQIINKMSEIQNEYS